MTLQRRTLLTALATLPLPLAASAQAPAWPARPIRVVLPFPAGGQTDAAVRYYTQKVEATLGQPFVIDNKPGAATMLGTQEVARAAADGYTLLFNMTGMVSNMVLLPNVRYDAFKDFVPVHRTYELYGVFAVPGGVPYKTLAAFVAAAKAAREPLTFGTTGHASSSHYIVAMLAKQAGVNLIHIPYKGEAPMLPDLMANRVNAAIISGASVKQFPDGIRALAASGNKRPGLLPNLPTFQELGYPGIGNESFAGFYAPAGTPRAIVARLNQEFNRISQLAETRERMAAIGLEPAAPGSPEQFLATMKSAYDEWVANSKAVDIKPQ